MDGEPHYFDWEGDPLTAPSSPACNGHVSPDGRYLAQQRGFPLGKYHSQSREDTGLWPHVVILDSASCEPILRVLSAFTYVDLWQAAWLSDSTAYVVGLTDGGYAMARVHPRPGISYLPNPPAVSRVPGPIPAPSGGGRYFSYEFAGVYDAEQDEWKPIDFVSRWPDSQVSWDLTEWGATEAEIHYQTGVWGPLSSWDGWEGVAVEWLLVEPKVEYPPFSEELRFVIAGSGSCVDLLEDDLGAPDARAVVGCLRDGARVFLAAPPGFAFLPRSQLRSGWLSFSPDVWARWAHIRSEDGLEGWVSIEYLRHE